MSAHEDLSRKHEIKGVSDRTFGLTIAIFLVLVGVWPLAHHRPLRAWALASGAALLAAALLRPAWLHQLNRAWTWIGATMNRVVSPLVSGLMFYAVVTPVAALRRRKGNDPLRLRRDESAASYWIYREPPGPEPKSMANQF